MRVIAAFLLALSTASAFAQTPPLRSDQAEFRALLKEMVETDTSITTGSCTVLADRLAARLTAAGYAGDNLLQFAVPDHPKEGGIVAILPGTSKTEKPILLLGHLDVVVAKREDWTRDPFTLIEEGGYFYARGTADMKGLDAIWVDTMIRFRQAGYKPKRTIKLALTCGEETTGAFNGAEWLAKNHPDWIAAGFALNEGGSGRADGPERTLTLGLHVGEKTVQNYRVEATNPGGHSSVPRPDNAIYDLAAALEKLRGYEFPAQLNDTTRAYFARAAATRQDETGRAMAAIARNVGDQAAEAVLNRDPTFHSLLRTTCVATLLDGGHANNALPQRAGANINCRIFPGVDVVAVRAELERVIANPAMKVTLLQPIRPKASPIPLDPRIVVPAERAVAKYFPGVPMIPTMSTGGTDGIYLAAIGIPVYGAPGLAGDPDGGGVHGLNERTSVQRLYTARDMLAELIRVYAEGR